MSEDSTQDTEAQARELSDSGGELGATEIGQITNWTYVLIPDLQVYGLKTFSTGNFCGILDVLGMVHNVPRNTLVVPLDGKTYNTMYKAAKRREDQQKKVPTQRPDQGAPLLQAAIEEADARRGPE